MKTQISNLKSGMKNQLLNTNIDYSTMPRSTTHDGHCGSNRNEVAEIWEKVTSENNDKMKILLFGVAFTLKANWSKSRKSVIYSGPISREYLEEKIGLKAAKAENPAITISDANIITVHNGKNSYVYLCPSLISIL